MENKPVPVTVLFLLPKRNKYTINNEAVFVWFQTVRAVLLLGSSFL